jgi:hypothetical protein
MYEKAPYPFSRLFRQAFSLKPGARCSRCGLNNAVRRPSVELPVNSSGFARARSSPPHVRTYLLNQSTVRLQARSAARLLYRSRVASDFGIRLSHGRAAFGPLDRTAAQMLSQKMEVEEKMGMSEVRDMSLRKQCHLSSEQLSKHRSIEVDKEMLRG